jgi:hypothetical protein
MSKLGEN